MAHILKPTSKACTSESKRREMLRARERLQQIYNIDKEVYKEKMREKEEKIRVEKVQHYERVFDLGNRVGGTVAGMSDLDKDFEVAMARDILQETYLTEERKEEVREAERRKNYEEHLKAEMKRLKVLEKYKNVDTGNRLGSAEKNLTQTQPNNASQTNREEANKQKESVVMEKQNKNLNINPAKMLVANDKVKLQNGSVLTAKGTSSTKRETVVEDFNSAEDQDANSIKNYKHPKYLGARPKTSSRGNLTHSNVGRAGIYQQRGGRPMAPQHFTHNRSPPQYAGTLNIDPSSVMSGMESRPWLAGPQYINPWSSVPHQMGQGIQFGSRGPQLYNNSSSYDPYEFERSPYRNGYAYTRVENQVEIDQYQAHQWNIRGTVSPDPSENDGSFSERDTMEDGVSAFMERQLAENMRKMGISAPSQPESYYDISTRGPLRDYSNTQVNPYARNTWGQGREFSQQEGPHFRQNRGRSSFSLPETPSPYEYMNHNWRIPEGDFYNERGEPLVAPSAKPVRRHVAAAAASSTNYQPKKVPVSSYAAPVASPAKKQLNKKNARNERVFSLPPPRMQQARGGRTSNTASAASPGKNQPKKKKANADPPTASKTESEQNPINPTGGAEVPQNKDIAPDFKSNGEGACEVIHQVEEVQVKSEEIENSNEDPPTIETEVPDQNVLTKSEIKTEKQDDGPTNEQNMVVQVEARAIPVYPLNQVINEINAATQVPGHKLGGTLRYEPGRGEHPLLARLQGKKI